MKTTTLKPKELKTSHRAVAPVIATLLMVAIAVVGGTIIFVFSQGFFSSSQISGSPTIEAVKILGYDARAVTDLQSDNGNALESTGLLAESSGNGDPDIQRDERVVVYVTNDSVQKVVIGELRFGGTIYNYTQLTNNELSDWDEAADLIPGTYAVLTSTPAAGTASGMLTEGAAEMQPGETVTFVIDLDSDLRVGRGTQFKLTTSNGGTFVSTVNVGQQSG